MLNAAASGGARRALDVMFALHVLEKGQIINFEKDRERKTEKGHEGKMVAEMGGGFSESCVCMLAE